MLEYVKGLHSSNIRVKPTAVPRVKTEVQRMGMVQNMTLTIPVQLNAGLSRKLPLQLLCYLCSSPSVIKQFKTFDLFLVFSFLIEPRLPILHCLLINHYVTHFEQKPYMRHCLQILHKL